MIFIYTYTSIHVDVRVSGLTGFRTSETLLMIKSLEEDFSQKFGVSEQL